MRHCFFLLSFVLLSCSVAESEDRLKMVEIKFLINQEALASGKAVLESSLINNGGDLKFLPWNTPFDESVNGHFLRVTEIRDNGIRKEVAYLGRMVKRAAPIESDYINIGAGETLKNQMDITKDYNFCRNRHYNVSLFGDFFDADHRSVQVKVVGTQFKANDTFPICGN